ncbi:hypothetical protein L486_02689 [Kwoniella mangroviensis CBS 10435]|uniref:Uncharacterized protein n=1 Tax=Kwoniella mangroviensis CBS 10435 TaxID=1331196 RepID=A0A1B9IWW2_9TREE|nr:hypothetical protein L486_02689 [Kwoniella mangroviensis CBS 10435]
MSSAPTNIPPYHLPLPINPSQDDYSSETHSPSTHHAVSLPKSISQTGGRWASDTTYTTGQDYQKDHPNSKPSSLPQPSKLSRRGSSPQKSPLRRLFHRNILPISPSTTSTFSSASATRSYEIYLYDYGSHSEIRFEPVINSPQTPSHVISNSMEESPNTGYRIACTKMTEKEVVLTCNNDRVEKVASLNFSVRGTWIKIMGEEGTAWLEEGDKGSDSQKIHLDGAIYQWAETTGLAMLVDLETRRKIAKLHFNVIARDKLMISEEGFDKLPLIIVSAAKVRSLLLYISVSHHEE